MLNGCVVHDRCAGGGRRRATECLGRAARGRRLRRQRCSGRGWSASWPLPTTKAGAWVYPWWSSPLHARWASLHACCVCSQPERPTALRWLERASRTRFRSEIRGCVVFVFDSGHGACSCVREAYTPGCSRTWETGAFADGRDEDRPVTPRDSDACSVVAGDADRDRREKVVHGRRANHCRVSAPADWPVGRGRPAHVPHRSVIAMAEASGRPAETPDAVTPHQPLPAQHQLRRITGSVDGADLRAGTALPRARLIKESNGIR